MRNHMQLARVPQGQERDYVRGLLHCIYRSGREIKIFMSGVWLVIVLSMWSVVGQGIDRVREDGLVALFPVMAFILITTAFSVIAVLNIIGGLEFRTIDGINNIRVWDVQITKVRQTMGRRIRCMASVMFADGTPGLRDYEPMLYSSEKYQQGLLVAVYNDKDKLIDARLIPVMGAGTKAYKLAMKWLQ